MAAVLIARQKTDPDLPDRAAWKEGDDVFIGPESSGPQAARWECSYEKWNRWFDRVYAPAGWCRV